MKSAVVVFPGTNRERDAAQAIQLVTGKAAHMVWHGDAELPAGVDFIVLPGGFSYGDYLRCGAMAARSPIMNAIKTASERGVKVLGICNGFQVLCESGLLPGVLQRNTRPKFRCKTVQLRVETSNSMFTNKYTKGQVIDVPIAHGEGNYFADDATLKQLEQDDRVVFRYCTQTGLITPEASPNGASNNIAGILNEKRNVLGMMPHPENHILPEQGCTHGKALFESVLAA